MNTRKKIRMEIHQEQYHLNNKSFLCINVGELIMDMKVIVSSIAKNKEVIGQIATIFNDYFKSVIPIKIGIQKYDNYLCFFVDIKNFSRLSYSDAAGLIISIESIINQSVKKNINTKNDMTSDEMEGEFEEEKPNIQIDNLAKFDEKARDKFFKKEMIDFNEGNFKEIQEFLKKNYPNCFEQMEIKNSETNVLEQRSSSPTPFWSSEPNSPDEDEVMMYLQSNTVLYKKIQTTPELLEKCAGRVRKGNEHKPSEKHTFIK